MTRLEFTKLAEGKTICKVDRKMSNNTRRNYQYQLLNSNIVGGDLDALIEVINNIHCDIKLIFE